jgi:nitrogen fixation/metabolism regulation signal transduction histidine kinase
MRRIYLIKKGIIILSAAVILYIIFKNTLFIQIDPTVNEPNPFLWLVGLFATIMVVMKYILKKPVPTVDQIFRIVKKKVKK